MARRQSPARCTEVAAAEVGVCWPTGPVFARGEALARGEVGVGWWAWRAWCKLEVGEGEHRSMTSHAC